MGKKDLSLFRDFYEEVGKKYPEEEIVYRALRGRLRREFIQKHLSLWNGRLLDVGCNQGVYLRSYSGGWKVGVDVSWHVLKRIRNRRDDTTLVVADAQALDCFRACVFDFILCSEVLEHVTLPERVMEGMFRLLIPGGKALVTVPNYLGKRPEWEEIGIMKGYGIDGIRENLYYHTAFRPEELVSMGREVGFQVFEKGTLEKEVKYAAKIPFLMYTLLRHLNRHTFQNPLWDHHNQRMYDALTKGIYTLVRNTGLDPLFLKWISEGVRSYAIFERPKS